ncbi:solute carrier organic anion transporter family member 1B3-like [Heterocephalus glaber]|uniref:Solute carrier organic anion transporter family member n=1 Tax=Heterocephalus glaber TaxID=10181 RepID=A0AAX6T1J2_HETGA|nr:solute carrier organic anion transporter family member 1B3-like [Heterocephalus glaber]
MDQYEDVNETTETDSSGKRKTRCCNAFKMFFVALSCSYICKTLGGMIMKTSITQIERRFDISSSVAGIIDGGFEIGNLFVILFVSYFGSKLHRPKLIGIGCAIMGAGGILTALPHFFMGYYRYSSEAHDNTSENSLSTCLIGQTSSFNETPAEIVGKGTNLFILDSIRITPQDARWVGAWWLGFLVSGLLSILSSIPFFFLPRNPNEPQKQRRKASTSLHGLKTDEEKNQTANLTNHSQDVTITGFLKSMNCLLNNRLYVLYVLYTLIHISSLIGGFTYLFKFIEQQFGQTASQATFLMGLIILPNMAAGIVLGGYLIKKLKLTIVGIAKFGLLTSSINIVFQLLYFGLICESKSVAGLTLTYDGLNPVTSHANVPLSYCNSECNCDESQWEPLCGDNGITYLSPCLAGCTSRSGNKKSTVFYNCSCVEVSGFPSTNFSAHLGECPRDAGCKKKYYIYTSIQFLLAFVGALGGTSFIMLIVRIVQPELKSLAMGFHSLIIRTLAGILSPIYYGAMIDTTCLKWSVTTCGSRGACRMYNSVLFGKSFFGLGSSLKLASFILNIVFFHLLKKKYEGKDGKTLENGGKVINEANLESSNNNKYFVPSATVKETYI